MSPNASLAGPEILRERLEVFFSLFRPTLNLAESFIKSKSYAQELVLLICARLDALASCTTPEDQSNRLAFIRLLLNYAGYCDLMESVSAGDLFYELGYHRWLVEGLIPKPGRLHRFSRINDPIIHLLDRSGIPLTADAAYRLFTRTMRALVAKFRCKARQRLNKSGVGKPKSIIAALEVEFRKDADFLPNLEGAFQPLLDTRTVASIFYEKFRNNAVHGVKVEFDEATFFKARKPYFDPLYSEYYGSFLFIKFPGPFLIELLENCMKTLQQKMLATGKLPPDIHTQAFGFGLGDELQFLDFGILPKGTDLGIQRK